MVLARVLHGAWERAAWCLGTAAWRLGRAARHLQYLLEEEEVGFLRQEDAPPREAASPCKISVRLTK